MPAVKGKQRVKYCDKIRPPAGLCSSYVKLQVRRLRLFTPVTYSLYTPGDPQAYRLPVTHDFEY